jgi:O-antigen/teichoic acid export membrane protein
MPKQTGLRRRLRELAGNNVLTRLTALLQGVPWRFYSGYGIGRIAPLAVLPILTRVLTPGEFGSFDVLLAAVMLSSIVYDAGLGAAVIRYASAGRHASPDLIASGFTLQLLASAVGFVVAAPLLILSMPDTESILASLLALSVFALFEGLAVLESGFVRAEARDDLYLAFSIVRFVATFVFAAGGAILFGVPGALIGLGLGGIGFATHTLIRYWKVRGFGSSETRRRLLRYGLPLTATTLAAWTLTLSDRVFLEASVPIAEIGEYGANYRLGSVTLVLFATPLVLAWLPVAQRLTPDERRATQRTWIRWYLLIAGAAVASLTAASLVLIPLVFGSGYEALPDIVFLIASSGLFGGVAILIATPLLVSQSTFRLAVVALFSVVFNVTVNFLLIPPFGVRGAAFATALSYVASLSATFFAVRFRMPDEPPGPNDPLSPQA